MNKSKRAFNEGRRDNRIVLAVMIVLALSLAPDTVRGDPGIADTVRTHDLQVLPGDHFPYSIFLFNDENLTGGTLGFKWLTADLFLDSLSFAGSVVSYLPDGQRPRTIDNVAHTVLIGFLTIMDPPVPPGTGVFATLWFTADGGAADQVIPFDSAQIGESGDFKIIGQIGNELIVPQYDGGAISIGCFDSSDVDGDGLICADDNCPTRYNPLQEDYDADGLGDSCYLPQVVQQMTVVIREYFAPGAQPAPHRQPPGDPELNLLVIDPEGFVIGSDSLGTITNSIGYNASYSNINAEDSIHIDDPKTGEYTVLAIGEAGSDQTGRAYTIGIRTDGTVEDVFGPNDSPLSGESDTVEYETTPLFTDTDGDGAIDGADNCVTVTNPDQEDDDNDGFGDSCYVYTEYTPLTIVTRDGDNPESDPEINLYITDPDGLVIGADSLGAITNTIGISACYLQIEGNDSVVIDQVKVGEYQVDIIPEADQSGAATSYVVGVKTDGATEDVFGPSPTPTSGEVDTLTHMAASYLAGDCDSTKSVNIADATFMIARIFSGGPDCMPSASGDADCSGSFNIADVTFLIARIFSGGPPPGCY